MNGLVGRPASPRDQVTVGGHGYGNRAASLRRSPQWNSRAIMARSTAAPLACRGFRFHAAPGAPRHGRRGQHLGNVIGREALRLATAAPGGFGAPARRVPVGRHHGR